LIQVRFYAGLAEKAKCPEANLNGAPLTVEEILDKLSNMYPDVIFDGVLVAVDGSASRKERIVESGSTVALLPPIAGG
jgi:molybdopterin converting factor small subunit